MELVDLHLHSHFSRDGRGSIESFCAMAMAKGLKHICFTEHVEYNRKEKRMDLFFDVDTYLGAVERAREEHDKLFVYAGLEVGDPYYYWEDLKALGESYEFDFIIAAAHMFDGSFVGDEKYLKNKELSTIYREYFEAIEKILDGPFFDSIGHIDFPKRFLQEEKEYPLPLLERILKKMVALGKGIEINTSALRKGCKEPCPGREILSLYRRFGGEVVTLGSDAHEPKDMGAGIEEAIELLRETGFDGYYIFKKRRGYKQLLF